MLEKYWNDNGSRSNPGENNFEIIFLEAFDDFLEGSFQVKKGFMWRTLCPPFFIGRTVYFCSKKWYTSSYYLICLFGKLQLDYPDEIINNTGFPLARE